MEERAALGRIVHVISDGFCRAALVTVTPVGTPDQRIVATLFLPSGWVSGNDYPHADPATGQKDGTWHWHWECIDQ